MTVQYALEQTKRNEAAHVAGARQHATERTQDRALVCASCGYPITSRRQAMQMNGSHRHTFANPHGLVYRLGCFASADGCTAAGGEHVDFSWFTGYAWSVEQCGRCGVHLGWRFRSGVHVFHGLICDRLAEEHAPGPAGHTR